MKNSLRTLAITFAAVCVLLIMAVPSFADHEMNGKGYGYYMIEDETIPTYSTTDQVKVHINIQGRCTTGNNPTPIEADRVITLSGKTAYTVRDALIQFNTESTTYKAYDYDGDLMSNTSTVVSKFKNSTLQWGSLFWYDIMNIGERIYVDGWMFRVNGKAPMKYATNPSNPPVGTMIYDTPIKAGDTITFFFNFPFTIGSYDFSTIFVAADTKYTAPSGSGTGTLQVQLQQSRDNHYDANNNYAWTITSYTDYAPGSTTDAYVYDSNFDYVTDFELDSSGYGTVDEDLDPGVYYIKVEDTKTYKSVICYITKTGNTTGQCYCLNSTSVYDRFVIPN